MATDSTSRTLLLLAGVALLGWCVWLVRDVLPPFLIAIALALLLDPVLDRMQKVGLPRWAAAGLTFLAFFGTVFALMAVLLPVALGQIGDLARSLPEYVTHLQNSVDRWALDNAALLRRMNLPPSVSELWQQYQRDITGYAQVLLERVFLSLQASAGFLGWVVVVPIVTLYLLIDLDALRARLAHLIPDRHRNTVFRLTLEVGRVFGAYLRGLTAICLCFGLLIYLVLELGFGLRYAVVLGLLAVVLYAVPYLGQVTLILVAVLVAWVTGRNPGSLVALAVAMLAVGQVFDQLITPRVIGRQVGLHPVLGVFALMVGGQLFGLPGMVVAVPVAASLRVVLLQLFPRLSEPVSGPELAPTTTTTLS
ncbi:MAG: putative permease [Armatimonadetes bacterium]|jgi:predicted PurR-regulated permease PerM|nr:putative permease [Armatimonadota bacterium]